MSNLSTLTQVADQAILAKITKQPISADQIEENSGRVNQNCWLARNVNRPPSKRCQYCEARFDECLFSRYLLITLILVSAIFLASYITYGSVSKILVASVFIVVLVYGYFFNNSTEAIVKANFSERVAKEAFRNLNKDLEKKVDEQTKELREQNSNLEKLLIMRSEFLDIASHQLRTPVSVIKGMLSMIVDGSIADEMKKKEFIESSFKKSIKLGDIINDILRASEMDTGKFEAKETEINLNKFLADIYDDKKNETEAKNLKLVLSLPKEEIKINADLKFLEQIILNLINNSLQYTKQGSITIQLSEEKKRAQIRVIDTGIGIPEESKNNLFYKFVRAQNACDTYTDGTGLGLFISRKMIEAHKNASISIEKTKLNEGTTFLVEFDKV